MKVIVSHDVDHITVWEHYNDLIIPKFIIRSVVEFISGYISLSEIADRCKNIIKNKWNNLEELVEFNQNKGIPATFFIGVSNGKGLKYSLGDAEYWIKKVLERGFEVGVHGINFDSMPDMKKERDNFHILSGENKFGMRMHYLRNSENTMQLLDESGYAFDSSIYEIKNPFKNGRLWEFPLHIMDGNIFLRNSRWQNQNLRQAINTTKRLIDEVFIVGINYLTIDFHDRYFSDSFRTWKEWYIWLIQYLKDNKLKFISYHEAIKELENDNTADNN